MGCRKENPRREMTRTGNIAYRAKLKYGEGGIRTLDTGINPYNGLANRRFRPLSHLSKIGSRVNITDDLYIITKFYRFVIFVCPKAFFFYKNLLFLHKLPRKKTLKNSC